MRKLPHGVRPGLRFPIALAPEGQVSYHNERVARLEDGTAQLGFWCLEDLKRQAQTEEVHPLMRSPAGRSSSG